MKETAKALNQKAQELQNLIDTPYNPVQTKTKWDWLRPTSFEEYLGYVFMAEEPENVMSKERFDDNFDNWLEDQDVSKIIELADKYEAKTF